MNNILSLVICFIILKDLHGNNFSIPTESITEVYTDYTCGRDSNEECVVIKTRDNMFITQESVEDVFEKINRS